MRAILPADWQEFLAKQEKAIKQAPNPTRRHQPRITRHMSARMRRVGTQTRNRVRAIYNPESDHNTTPTKPETWRGTRSPGISDPYNAGKATVTRLPRSWR